MKRELDGEEQQFLDLSDTRGELVDYIASTELSQAKVVAFWSDRAYSPHIQVSVVGVLSLNGEGAIFTRKPTYWLVEVFEPVSEAVRRKLTVLGLAGQTVEVFSQSKLNALVQCLRTEFPGTK